MNINNLWSAVLVVFIPFFSVASLLFFIFYVVKDNTFLFYKIQAKFPQIKDYKREFFYSIISSIIFAIVIYFSVFHSVVYSKSMIYENKEDYGLIYLFVSPILLILIHDAYFYWTHRLLHTPFLFRFVHIVHHKSHNPTPWAAFAFHPIEAVVNIGILPLIIFFIPIYKNVLFGWWLFVVIGNILGHLGYDPVIKHLDKVPFKWLVMSTHHNIHHQKSNIFFGFYLMFWDKIMKTDRKTD